MSDQLAAGTIIGDRYRLTRALGSGGFGTVYEAEHLFIKRVVAVKVLDRLAGHPHAEKLATRFLREAELAAKIEHSHVVTIYDFGFTGPTQTPYLAMQLLEGLDLREELVRHGPMPPARALPLFAGVLDGLAEAHRLDIVHKDLKPSNLVVRHGGTAREALCIVDFGLACLLDRDVSRLTESGHLSGTPRYLSPEYIRDQLASPALDVYQMGLILVEALTGVVVVQSDDLYVVLMAHCSGQLPVPANLLDSPLGPVIRRSLALQPTARYPDAAAFRDALARIDPAAVPTPGAAMRMLNAGDASPILVPHALDALPRGIPAEPPHAPSVTSVAALSNPSLVPLAPSRATPTTPTASLEPSADLSGAYAAPTRPLVPILAVAAVIGVASLLALFFALSDGASSPDVPPPVPHAAPTAPEAAAAPLPPPDEPPSLDSPDTGTDHAVAETDDAGVEQPAAEPDPPVPAGTGADAAEARRRRRGRAVTPTAEPATPIPPAEPTRRKAPTLSIVE